MDTPEYSILKEAENDIFKRMELNVVQFILATNNLECMHNFKI